MRLTNANMLASRVSPQGSSSEVGLRLWLSGLEHRGRNGAFGGGSLLSCEHVVRTRIPDFRDYFCSWGGPCHSAFDTTIRFSLILGNTTVDVLCK